MSNTTGFRVQKPYAEGKGVIVFEKKAFDIVGRMAIVFVEKWGMVAAMPDGEDSAGRSKLRLASVDEVVTRAFDMAGAVYAEAMRRGLVVELPDLNELNAEDDARRSLEEEAERERRAEKRAKANFVPEQP